MSFAARDLQIGVLELFVDAAGLSDRRTDFDELPHTAGRAIQAPRELVPQEEAWRRQVAAQVRHGACPHCGALSREHRCPVYIVGVST